LPLTILAGFIGGGLWGLIAGAPQGAVRREVTIITTVMLRYDRYQLHRLYG